MKSKLQFSSDGLHAKPTLASCDERLLPLRIQDEKMNLNYQIFYKVIVKKVLVVPIDWIVLNFLYFLWFFNQFFEAVELCVLLMDSNRMRLEKGTK